MKPKEIDSLVAKAIKPIAHLLRGAGDANTVSRWVRKFNADGQGTRRIGGHLYNKSNELVLPLDLTVFEYSKVNFERLASELDENAAFVIDQMLDLLRDMVDDLATNHPKIVT